LLGFPAALLMRFPLYCCPLLQLLAFGTVSFAFALLLVL